MPEQGSSPALFFETVNAYHRTEALRAALELDLFTAVGAGQTTAAQIAASCGTSARGIRILADYLTVCGLFRKVNDRYELTPDSAAFLDRRSPTYLGGAIDFLLKDELRGAFRLLTAAVRRGGTAILDEGTVSHDNPIWVVFARAMAPVMRLPARLLADLVGGEPQRSRRVLDVAAGHGLPYETRPLFLPGNAPGRV